VPGEVHSILSLQAEWDLHNNQALCTILLGDINVHHIGWLKNSSRNSEEGVALRTFCDGVGLRQIVTEPTRGDHLLDLILTDLDDVRCKVLPKIADHNGLLATLPLRAPKVATITREVWQFAKADWEGLTNALSLEDWSWICDCNANEAAQRLTDEILTHARKFIPRRIIQERRSTHPWINDRVVQLVQQKKAAEGTGYENEAKGQCSAGILEEYGKYVGKERDVLKALPRGRKQWWAKSRQLLQKRSAISSIPALKVLTSS
jgi:hypothetical protein